MNAVKEAESLNIARELILRPGGLDDSRLDHALSQVMSSSVDAADLYFQLSREESWALEDGIVKEGSASIEQGVGRARPGRREDRVRVFGRNRAAGARGSLARGTCHRGARQ